MKTSGIAGVLAGILAAGTALADQTLTLAAPIPISLAHAPSQFEQCSRSAPQPEGPVWLPSQAEIAQLESDLLQFYADNPWSFDSATAPPPAFRGHYVGFARGYSRYIYASYVPEDVFAGFPDDAAGVLVCDGGADFWGIVYEPATRTFGELEFNGSA